MMNEESTAINSPHNNGEKERGDNRISYISDTGELQTEAADGTNLFCETRTR